MSSTKYKLRWNEADGDTTWYQNTKAKFFSALKKVLVGLRKHGYANHLSRVTWVYAPHDRKGMIAAEYNPEKRWITIYGLGIFETKVYYHEFAHYVWREILKPLQKTDWELYIKKNQLRFTEEDYTHIEKAMVGFGDDYFSGKDLIPKIQNPLTKQLIIAFVRQTEGYIPKNIRWFRDRTKEPFMVALPTEYANTNVEEAFAEVYGFFVDGKPLDPVVEVMFRRITGLRR